MLNIEMGQEARPFLTTKVCVSVKMINFSIVFMFSEKTSIINMCNEYTVTPRLLYRKTYLTV